MARSGLHAQLGFAAENDYGDAEKVDRFLPLISETVSQTIERIESEAIYAGRYTLDSDAWFAGNVDISGNVNLEVYDRAIGLLFEHILGEANTDGTGPYVHTFTPGDTFGKSLTMQIGRPSVLGVVHPFTYAGVKITEAEITAQVGQIARLALSVVGQSETTGEPLEEVTYPAGLRPFTFVDGAITVAGTEQRVREVRLSLGAAMNTGRRFLGSGQIHQPIDNALRAYTGDLQCEFEDLTAYNRFVNGTEAAMVLNFTAGANSMVITQNVRFDGTTPHVEGRDVLNQPLPIKAVGGTDAGALTVVITNSDAAP